MKKKKGRKGDVGSLVSSEKGASGLHDESQVLWSIARCFTARMMAETTSRSW